MKIKKGWYSTKTPGVFVFIKSVILFTGTANGEVYENGCSRTKAVRFHASDGRTMHCYPKPYDLQEYLGETFPVALFQEAMQTLEQKLSKRIQEVADAAFQYKKETFWEIRPPEYKKGERVYLPEEGGVTATVVDAEPKESGGWEYLIIPDGETQIHRVEKNEVSLLDGAAKC